MAYRVKFGANLEKDVRRLLSAQIGRAVAQLSGLTDGASAVHETRKSLKRCRAILRLARPGLSKSAFTTEDHALRAIGRILSQERDREVMTHTLGRLSAGSRSPAEKLAVAAVDTAFGTIRLNGVSQDDTESDVRLAFSMLQQADRSVRKLAVSPARIETLAAGFARTYTEARRAMRTAYRTGQDETFHAFRKLVQHHWRHLQLLSPAWQELFEVRIAAARQLAQILGDDHDLAVLAAHLSENDMRSLDTVSRDTVTALARAEQARLRAEARPLAGRLFAQSPRDMERLVVKLWPAALRLARHPRPAEKSPAPAADETTVAEAAPVPARAG